ncbi:tRNA pseudouridine(38-40) synthase [Malassezia nana]|uniref:tRNA pseudouridine synthase 1 n=1 Tax=Malassezia nana TaxID=180528 RepID=A0AAF0J279_9BASI|nr:tRNA pseudouridine(38-40) synthase [Malassezia nana]
MVAAAEKREAPSEEVRDAKVPRTDDDNQEPTGRLAKRKVAIFFGYCGSEYSGLQVNPGVKTIEGDIFDAFCRAGAVSKDNAVNPNKVQLQRAARTDRGVHAAGNLLTLKLILEPPNMPVGQTLTEYVNTLLPTQIRIWGMRRVQSAFNARTSCDSRLYEYLLPTYVFIPPKPFSSMWKMLRRLNTGEEEMPMKDDAPVAPWDDPAIHENPMLCHPFWQAHGTSGDFAQDMLAKRQWRMDAATLERVRRVFHEYTGSHNFHNYTVGKEFRDRSAHRVMKKLTISDPRMIHGTEWVSVQFHGQSFMLHQIRKMIGLLVLIGRTNAPASLVAQTYGPARIHVPKAPGLGLLLVEPFFGGYNQKVTNNNERIDRVIEQRRASSKPLPPDAESGRREHVDYAAFQDEMDKFKQTFIYDQIYRTEEETAEFAKWLNYLDVFVGPDFEFLNPTGTIPTSAILKVGEQRRAPGGQPKAVDMARADSDEEGDAQGADDDA